METVKLPKKFREVCYRIMDGNENALTDLETFVKYSHQVAAVKAEVAYFNGEWEKALELDMEILPYFHEWYYANVGNEHRAAMVVAALKLGREKQLTKRFNEVSKLLKEDSDDRPQTIKNISIMKSYLRKNMFPYSDAEYNVYLLPKNPLRLNEIKEKLNTLISKKYIGTPYGKLRLFYLAYQDGYPEDAAKSFEDVDEEEMTSLAFDDAINLFNYLGEKEKTLEIIEKYATSRLWHVAAATQVRPMDFFTKPVILEYLLNPEILPKIRKAAEIDNGTIIRK